MYHVLRAYSVKYQHFTFNPSFLSKTFERIATFQIEEYLTTNGLFAKMQSAHRKHHSTETALLRVVNDIRQAIDNK